MASSATGAAGERARRALMDDAREEEAITVNQRALIDKILARYAAEFTVFRELLQNADDAGATHCELRFESQRAKSAVAASSSSSGPASSSSASSSSLLPDFKATLQNWVFRNDGKPFGKDDWSRLRRIAEGNPDPDRIGAFGVGFYSLFSICEEPIVSSADELMGFFWKGDALFTKRAKNASQESSPSGNPWTTFFMALREPSPFPESPMALCKFLATSLTFTTKIRSIGLYWDDQMLCKLEKKLGMPKSMPMPAHLNAHSPAKIMKVRDLESTAVQIDVEAMQHVIDAAEKDKPKPKQSLASALGKTAGGGLTSMLQSAFGFSSSSSREKEKELQRQREAEARHAAQKASDSTAALLATTSASIHLRIATAHVSVSADRAFEREIERSTKKPPPKVTAFQLIFTGKEEYDASFPEQQQDDVADNSTATSASTGIASLDSGVRQIFAGLMPRLEDQGHTFIGFRTHQTTGFSGHIAARFIPTVERESLDFIDRYCAQWNSELLSMGGYVARAVYENELQDIARLWSNTFQDKRPADDDKLAKALKDRALHLMRFFTFRNSSPSSRVSSLFLTCFFGAARQNTISLMSTRGVKHSGAVRIPNALLADFVRDLAVIPPDHVDLAPDFVREVRSRNLVQDITMDDVFNELGSRALTSTEMTACLKWWVSVAAHPSYDVSLRPKLINNAMLTIADPKDKDVPEKIQPLSVVRHYLNTSRLPTDVPLPDSCLSYEVSKSFSANELSRVFGWSELSVPVWLKNVVQLSTTAARVGATTTASPDNNLQVSPAFAEKVLLILSRTWFALPASQHGEIQQMLADVTCIPTRAQMQKPNDAYFANVSLFSDLPIVAFPSAQVKGNLEKLLVALGVRRHVELQMIFNRLVAGGGWSHVDLVGYLASNKDSLSDLEKERLRKTAIFPKHGEDGPLKEDGKHRIIRYRASDLYEPTEALKALNLPVLDWADKSWKPSSDEAKFVFDLGLKRFPPMEEILALASESSNETLRANALSFFLDKFHAHYSQQYTIYRSEKFAFVPARLPSQPKMLLQKPTEVFTNAEAAVMGFAIVGPEINPADLPKLGLRSNPTSTQLIGRLVNIPTKDEAQARKIFEYLATVPEFSLNDFSLLKAAEFIPVRRSKRGPTSSNNANKEAGSSESEIVLVAPGNCYFGGSSSDSQFKDVFFYCDYGSVAGAFLKNCGVRNEPSIEEVAERLISEPQRFYQLAGSADAYLGILRQIATNWNRMRGPLRTQMARSAFLLGSKRITEGKSSDKKTGHLLDDDDDDEDEDAGTLVYALKKPSEVVIVDDANSHMLFGSTLFYAPHEDLLQEGLYGKLGSPRLSSLIEERYSVDGRVLKNTQRAREMKALVLERTPLFLFEKRQSARSEIRRDAEWLKASLDVEEVDGPGLRLIRTLRYDRIQEQNVQKCSAMASIQGSRLVLHLSSSMEVDFFEVATALNRYLLTKQRLQEVLLYMTLLSTSLRNLKRRGFHVDKILSQRKTEREAAEAKMREERMQAEMRATEEKANATKLEEWKQQVLSVFPDADPQYVERALRSHSDAHVERTTNDMLSTDYPRRNKERDMRSSNYDSVNGGGVDGFDAPSQGALTAAANSGGGLFSGFKSRFMQASSKGRSSLADGTSSIERSGSGDFGMDQPSQPISAAGRMDQDRALGSLPPVPQAPVATAPTSEVTPLSTIHNNVLNAIRASRPDASSTIKSDARQTTIKEAANSYCDVTGVETDLKLAGEVSGMKIFLHPSLDPASMLQSNAAALDRLINQVYKPIGNIFGLDPRSMYVFADTVGPSIAFNRGGAIYLNFRYYLAWHDQQVKEGKLAEPLVSTYFSVAHEIAHNVVAAHNAEHEWYFSAIAEKYVVALTTYIATAEASRRETNLPSGSS